MKNVTSVTRVNFALIKELSVLNLGNWTKKVARSAMAVGAAALVVSGPVQPIPNG